MVGKILSRDFSDDFFSSSFLRIQKYVDEKDGPSIVASGFWNCFCVSLIGLVCVKGSEAKGRHQRAWFRHPSTRGLSPAMSNSH